VLTDLRLVFSRRFSGPFRPDSAVRHLMSLPRDLYFYSIFPRETGVPPRENSGSFHFFVSRCSSDRILSMAPLRSLSSMDFRPPRLGPPLCFLKGNLLALHSNFRPPLLAGNIPLQFFFLFWFSPKMNLRTFLPHFRPPFP